MAAVPMPSWLNRPDFVAAMEAGTSAGTQQAKLIQGQQQFVAQQGLAQQQLAARIAQAHAEEQLQAQEQVAKQALNQQTALRQQTQADIERAHNEALLGLKRSELDQEQKKIDAAAVEVARKHQAQQGYQQDAQALIQSGVAPEEAYTRAALKHGPAMNMPGTEFSALIRSRPKPMGNVSVANIPGQPGLVQVTNPDGSVSVRNAPVPQRKTTPQATVLKIRRLDGELKRLQKLQEAGESLGITSMDVSKLGPQAKATLKSYQDRQKQIETLLTEIKGLEDGTITSEGEDQAPQKKYLRWTGKTFEPIP